MSDQVSEFVLLYQSKQENWVAAAWRGAKSEIT
jgi:hypothetical protein